MGSFVEAGDEDDAVFLSAVAEAEAVSLRRLSHGVSKRQYVEPAESVSSSLHSADGAGYGDSGYGRGDGRYSDRDKEEASKRSRIEPEGEYMAALRGNHSETWQAMSSKARLDAKPRYGASSSYSRSTNKGVDSGGAQGRSSDVWPSRAPGSDSSNIPGEGQVPQKSCPCGGGYCLVLTANTEKNPGRQFYRCPLRKEEGQCGFFEWCDGMTNSSQGLYKEQGSSFAEAQFPCPCGAGPCVKLTAKTEKNMGRQFYRCPLNQGEGSCNFFKWCDECLPASDAIAPASGGSVFRESPSMSNVAPGQCLKCGMIGHWAKDCSYAVPNASPNKGYASTMRISQVGSGAAITCFKCNQPGHYANNCPNQQSSYGSKGPVGGFNRQGGENSISRGFPNASGYGSPGTGRNVGGVKSGVCFKCGSESHWANNCPNGSNSSLSSYGGGSYGQAKSGGIGSCYKCGGQGHYANACRADGKGQNMF